MWRETLKQIVDQTPDERLTDLAGELARAQAIVSVRLSGIGAQAPDAGNVPAGNVDDYLTAKQVAERLNVSVKFCYQHRSELGGRKVGGSVRFPERGIQRYLAGRK